MDTGFADVANQLSLRHSPPDTAKQVVGGSGHCLAISVYMSVQQDEKTCNKRRQTRTVLSSIQFVLYDTGCSSCTSRAPVRQTLQLPVVIDRPKWLVNRVFVGTKMCGRLRLAIVTHAQTEGFG